MDNRLVESLQKAIKQLSDGLNEYEQSSKSTLLRDGVIQRFEFTYELSWKTLKRFLEETYPTPALINEMSFPTLIRTGWEQGLLQSSWDAWEKYRDARNETSHTYDEQKAIKIFSKIPQFLDEVRYLYNQISKRIE